MIPPRQTRYSRVRREITLTEVACEGDTRPRMKYPVSRRRFDRKYAGAALARAWPLLIRPVARRTGRPSGDRFERPYRSSKSLLKPRFVEIESYRGISCFCRSSEYDGTWLASSFAVYCRSLFVSHHSNPSIYSTRLAFRIWISNVPSRPIVLLRKLSTVFQTTLLERYHVPKDGGCACSG